MKYRLKRSNDVFHSHDTRAWVEVPELTLSATYIIDSLEKV